MLRLSVYADKHHQSFAPINIIHLVEMRLLWLLPVLFFLVRRFGRHRIPFSIAPEKQRYSFKPSVRHRQLQSDPFHGAGNWGKPGNPIYSEHFFKSGHNRLSALGTIPPPECVSNILLFPATPDPERFHSASCPFCGAPWADVHHLAWVCKKIPGVTPLEEPKKEEWEAGLRSEEADKQRLLVGRAGVVIDAIGALD
ncbi:hypothetical protein HPB47_021327 [Ixodes persulcatus]|uniref:Uncharacterized protein n=1 Tax=Ixodes persulcatus TaxID=34615 RepID=A0AC60QCS2_IXOPE|nr:hypothetical protein HPB47_021327 [Ixodes persulcatus]